MMASENVNVRITGELKNHLIQQTGKYGLYENASEYIRSLIRHDLKSRNEAWKWLKNKLAGNKSLWRQLPRPFVVPDDLDLDIYFSHYQKQ